MPRREIAVIGIALVVVAVIAGGYWILRPDAPAATAPPFFYQLNAGDIERIAVSQGDITVAFAWDETDEVWRFDDATREEPDPDRWGGMPVLLAGPRIERELSAGLDLAQFGLALPRTTIRISLEGGAFFTVMVGNETPNGGGHYVMQGNDDKVLLVDSAWARVIERLVIEPPRKSLSTAQ
ncbi:MAG: DUF4340 domain-containing protein [Chloroflexi bacterium]|nr:DUF4340 domain-containing protein [Chloroflexota bacterium]